MRKNEKKREKKEKKQRKNEKKREKTRKNEKKTRKTGEKIRKKEKTGEKKEKNKGKLRKIASNFPGISLICLIFLNLCLNLLNISSISLIFFENDENLRFFHFRLNADPSAETLFFWENAEILCNSL